MQLAAVWRLLRGMKGRLDGQSNRHTLWFAILPRSTVAIMGPFVFLEFEGLKKSIGWALSFTSGSKRSASAALSVEDVTFCHKQPPPSWDNDQQVRVNNRCCSRLKLFRCAGFCYCGEPASTFDMSGQYNWAIVHLVGNLLTFCVLFIWTLGLLGFVKARPTTVTVMYVLCMCYLDVCSHKKSQKINKKKQ